MSRWLLVLVLVAICAMSASAEAGNRDGLLFGNDAALTAGAVIATGGDGGQLWYNPAGLGANDRRRFNVGGSAFVLSFRGRDEAVVTNLVLDEPAGRAQSVEFLSVPTTSSFMLRLRPGITLALGSFMVTSDQQSVGAVLQGSVPGAVESATVVVDVGGFHTALLFGAGLGFQPVDWLRVGFSLFALYERFEMSGLFALNTRNGDETAAILLNDQVSWNRIGLDSVVGVQIAPPVGLRLGLVVRTPRFAFLDFGRELAVETVGYGSSAGGFLDFALADNQVQGWGLRIIRMPVVALGAGWASARWSVGIEGDLTPPMTDPAPGVAPARLLWNVRIGGRLQISDRVELGTGLFTDRSDLPEVRSVLEQKIDWYGGTFGVRLRNPVALAAGGRAPDIVLVNTFALRYAAGPGEIAVIDVAVLSASDVGFTLLPRDVVFHELSLHIGTALHF